MQCCVVLLLMSSVVPADAPKTDPAAARAQADLARTVYAGLQRGQVTYALDPPYDPESIVLWSRRWAEAEAQAGTTKAARLAAFQAHVQRMRKLEREVQALVREQSLSPYHGASADYHRRQAEDWLARENAR